MLLLLCLPTSGFATLIDGIEYNLNSSKRTASVTSKKEKYSGDVILPSKVTYSGITYSVTSIEQFAFSSCPEMTSIFIPATITSIDAWAFSENPNFTKAEFESIESLCKIKFSSYTANPLYFAHNLWIDGKEVKDLVIPETVTSISPFAFYRSNITSVYIPKSVKTIGRHSFYECAQMTTIKISDSVTKIGEWAFFGCIGLTKAEFDNIEWLCKINFPSGDTNPLIYAHNLWINGEEITDLVIPETVTSIGHRAFCGASALKSVKIPDTVTSVGFAAFAECSGLPSIELPNSITAIREGAFSGCTSLTSIRIPDSITLIDISTFKDCTGLKSVEIPSSVTTIGNNAFSNCSGLPSIEIPNSVTTIENYAFYKCNGLTSMELPNSVSSIGAGAFQYCSELKSIILPESLASIGLYTFEYCTSLTMMECKAIIPPKVTGDTFYNFECNKCKLIVPEEALENYKADPVWSKFLLDIETGVNIVEDSSYPATIFDLSGRIIKQDVNTDIVNQLSPGIYIIRQNNEVKKILVR